MYENLYVKKHKRKKAAAFIGGVSTMGITALSIVAFLGRYTGTFTVTLNVGHVKLALSQDKNFDDGGKSFLMIDSLPKYEEYTYSAIKKNEANIDSDQTDYLYGQNKENGEIISLNYFKYTFFVKNIGGSSASYNLKVKILESNESADGRKIEETLRVALYQNNGYDLDAHESTVYAQKSTFAHKDLEGKQTFNEFITVSYDDATATNPSYGFAETFVDDSTICSIDFLGFNQNDMNRYTLVSWLEGYDPQSDERLGAPDGASLKLGVEINAYED